MKKLLFLGLLTVVVLGLTLRGTFGYFNDSEVSAGSTFTAWDPVSILADGFEGSPWDVNWDDNGASSWEPSGKKVHSGQWSAYFKGAKPADTARLTSDDLDTSGARGVTISFWFRPDLKKSDRLLVQAYNGTSYVTLYDLAEYPTYRKGRWGYFSLTLTDPQFLRSNFRLRFDASGVTNKKSKFYLDDVLVEVY